MNRYRDPSPFSRVAYRAATEERYRAAQEAAESNRERSRRSARKNYEKGLLRRKALREEAHRRHPHAIVLSAMIAKQMPEWCESEECGIDLLTIADALDDAGLSLVRDLGE